MEGRATVRSPSRDADGKTVASDSASSGESVRPLRRKPRFAGLSVGGEVDERQRTVTVSRSVLTRPFVSAVGIGPISTTLSLNR